MKREDIIHLASLARIRLTEQEIDDFATELPAILGYVSAVSDIAGDDHDTTPQPGVRFNIFRKDEVTNEPNAHTEAILAEMPHTEGRFMKVKKILKIQE